MGKLKEAHPELDVNKPKTLDTFIKMTYGTQDAFDLVLKKTKKTCNRWYNAEPRNFLKVLPELRFDSGMSADEILDLILLRDADLHALRNHENTRPEEDA